MKVIVALEARLDRTPDDRVWSDSGLNSSFWERYLEVFDEVHVVARLREMPEPPVGAARVDRPRVNFAPVPYFVGPWQFARRYLAIRRAVRAALDPGAAVILRVPGTIGTCLARQAQERGQPYALEVVGDPRQVFSPGAVRSRLRSIWGWWYSRNLGRQCKTAVAVSYVTESYLQQRYPPGPKTLTIACSDIDLRQEAFALAPRVPPATATPLRLLLIGSLAQLYKGPDVLIKAVALNAARGLDLRLTIIGDGKHRPELEALARECGIAERVIFAGRLPAGAAIRAELDQADLFVLPSRTEGMPRALLEAMARGLPCLASSVGGIPELLAPQDLVPPGDVVALADKIREVATNRQRLQQMAIRNLAKAQEYRAERLGARRRQFYQAVRTMTADWQKQVNK